jgi:hypothetical protein
MAMTKEQLAAAGKAIRDNPGIGRPRLMEITGCTDYAASVFLRRAKSGLGTGGEVLKSISDSDIAASLRVAKATSEAKLREARLALGDIGEAMRGVKSAIAAEPPVAFPHAAKRNGKIRPVTLVVQLTDWHIGLVTPEGMVEGFNVYNWETAQERASRLVDALRKYTSVLRAGYTVDDCVILCTGDYVSGDIHDGLVRTNEFQAPVQAVKAGRLIAETVRSVASFFPRVRVEFIAPGNHDRLSRKPQAQVGGENSWGYVVGSVADAILASQPNVKFRLITAMQDIVSVEGRRYLIGHGDGIIGTWGIPFYGIERKVSREAKARMNMPDHRHFHKIVIGHFHTGLDHPDWFVGGSLSGTDENDHKQGRHMPAHQTSWVVHPEHGEFGFTRWFL